MQVEELRIQLARATAENAELRRILRESGIHMNSYDLCSNYYRFEAILMEQFWNLYRNRNTSVAIHMDSNKFICIHRIPGSLFCAAMKVPDMYAEVVAAIQDAREVSNL